MLLTEARATKAKAGDSNETFSESAAQKQLAEADQRRITW